MKKSELIQEIVFESGMKILEVENILNSFTKMIIVKVKAGEKVNIPSLGSFEKVERAAREGINPATKEKIQIKAKKAPKFKASKFFKEEVNC